VDAISGGLDTEAPLTRQAHRSFSYDARWAKQIDPTSQLALSVDYHGTSVAPREIGAPPHASAPIPFEAILSSRSFGAAGTYELAPVPAHRVQVDFRARQLDAPADDLRTLATETMVASPGPTGLAMGLDAQDSWTPAGPVSLTFGFGYRQAIGPNAAAIFVPRVGGAWDTDRLRVRLVVSYHELAGTDPVDDGPVTAAFRPADEIGWNASIELPFAEGLSLAGHARSSPIELAELAWEQPATRPPFLTDGNAAVREQGLALIQQAGDTRTSLEYARGQVEGTLAAILTWDLPVHRLAERTMSYDTGRLGIRVVPSGTDVIVEYQRLAQLDVGDGGGGADQSAIELRILQDVWTARSLGSWRFLLALRAASVDSGGGAAEDAELLSALDHRLSAGLSFAF
jgi:hypothetical protein